MWLLQEDVEHIETGLYLTQFPTNCWLNPVQQESGPDNELLWSTEPVLCRGHKADEADGTCAVDTASNSWRKYWNTQFIFDFSLKWRLCWRSVFLSACVCSDPRRIKQTSFSLSDRSVLSVPPPPRFISVEPRHSSWLAVYLESARSQRLSWAECREAAELHNSSLKQLMCNNKTLKDKHCSHVNEQSSLLRGAALLLFLLLTSIFVAEHHQLGLS